MNDPTPAPDRFAESIDTVRMLARDADVVVFDLDGVIREFEAGRTDPVATAMGLTPQDFSGIAFHPDHIGEAVTGRISFAEWVGRIHERLVAEGIDPDLVVDGLAAWEAYRGTPIAATIALIDELQQAGRHCFVFTNGTDNVPAELDQIGLGDLVDSVLNSANFGVAKPDPAAYAAAHSAIESRLARSLEPGAVVFADDRGDNVTAAGDFGWRSVLFRPA